MIEWWLAGSKCVLQCCFVHCESHMKSQEQNLRRQWDNQLMCAMALHFNMIYNLFSSHFLFLLVMVCIMSVAQVLYIYHQQPFIVCRWTVQELEKAMVHLEWQLSVLLWIHDRQGASWYYPPREHSSTRSEWSTQTSLFRAVCQWLRLHQGLQDRQRRQSCWRSVKLMLWLMDGKSGKKK